MTRLNCRRPFGVWGRMWNLIASVLIIAFLPNLIMSNKRSHLTSLKIGTYSGGIEHFYISTIEERHRSDTIIDRRHREYK